MKAFRLSVAAVALGLSLEPATFHSHDFAHGLVAVAAAQTGDSSGSAHVQLWTCGMHPQVIQDHPGECPICHMKLTPLESEATDASAAGSAITIDPVVVQNMGVRTARAIEGPLVREVRVAGFVEEAQPLVHDVTSRVSGYIRRLYANTEGIHVRKGDPLYDLYSPEIQVAVEEMIALRRRSGGAHADPTLDSIRDATLRKLSLQGLDDAEIARLSRLDRAPEVIAFRSPVTGNVTEKPVVEGSAVTAGQKVLRIVDHSTVWIDARVYEQDLALVSVGQKIEARVASQADKVYAGEVVFLHPHLDETTRTASVRMAVANPDFDLRPGMFATVVLRGDLAPSALLVPREAVIDTGDRQVAFVVGDKPGHFEPRRVRTGWIAEGGNVQILEGLTAGEEVVVSGQFLLDAESRLQDALRKFIAQRSSTATAGTTASPAANAPAAADAPPAAPPHQH
ncbi:MAG TPA: efflux RND transporter periplasmic adaptor subunit [Candidatus Limnocylindrales bacterium]|nr:efflux RND transporter periplasmic adaptor subunit [Candidatus Limnocylindrales bacterium]